MLTQSKNELALFGGPKVLESAPVERWVKINAEVKAAVNALMDQGISTIPNASGVVGEFEEAFCAMTGSAHALTCNSGTSALHSAYFALGVGPGDEVLVPAYTWHASITPVLHCAATPVFVDIDPETLTISTEDLERKITPKTKAICVVHVWGNVCDMDAVMAISKKYGIPVVEDASHAHGAQWKGRSVGSMGTIGCFSCQGAKAVSGGELGVAVTDNPDLYDQMVLLGHFMRPKRGSNDEIERVGDMSLGIKYRAHAWGAAMAKVELSRLPELNRLRSRNYSILNDHLRGVEGISVIDPLPGAVRGGYLEYKFLLTPEVLEKATREEFVAAVQAEGVPLVADRYSSFNYTYGLLHTAPLFTTFDLRSVGGCFYDPTQPAGPRVPPSLPISEGIVSRLVGMEAYADVEPELVVGMAEGMRKVLERIECLRD